MDGQLRLSEQSIKIKFNSIEPSVLSGKDLQGLCRLSLEFGFGITWEAADVVGFENNGCRFILQKYDEKAFAENFMLSVKVDDLDEFWEKIGKLNLPEKFGVKLTEPTDFPWGREVNMIDIAGVCWHFGKVV
jgi:hypothetical protein